MMYNCAKVDLHSYPVRVVFAEGTTNMDVHHFAQKLGKRYINDDSPYYENLCKDTEAINTLEAEDTIDTTRFPFELYEYDQYSALKQENAWCLQAPCGSDF